MDEVYNKTILIDTDYGSFDDHRVSELIDNFQSFRENKRVKIINASDSTPFEDLINDFIVDNSHKLKILDIKYIPNSVMIIYEPMILFH